MFHHKLYWGLQGTIFTVACPLGVASEYRDSVTWSSARTTSTQINCMAALSEHVMYFPVRWKAGDDQRLRDKSIYCVHIEQSLVAEQRRLDWSEWPQPRTTVVLGRRSAMMFCFNDSTLDSQTTWTKHFSRTLQLQCKVRLLSWCLCRLSFSVVCDECIVT